MTRLARVPHARRDPIEPARLAPEGRPEVDHWNGASHRLDVSHYPGSEEIHVLVFPFSRDYSTQTLSPRPNPP